MKNKNENYKPMAFSGLREEVIFGERSRSSAATNNIVAAIQNNDVKSLKKNLKDKNFELTGFQNLTILHIAARWGKAEVIAVLMENSRVAQLLEHKMYNGDTPLLTAARYDNVDAVRVLLDYGADMKMKKIDTGNTVLHFAAQAADSELINLLLSRNPSPKFLNSINKSGETALELALKAQSPTVQILLQSGADYSKPNTLNGRNILHICVAYNQCGLAQELLTSGHCRILADLVDRRGDTPLMLAIRLACFQCVQLFIKHMKPGQEINSFTGESILHMAVKTDEDEILKHILTFANEKLMNYRDNKGMTALLFAIENHSDKCLERLIKSKAVFAMHLSTKETAMHTAIRVNNRLALSILLSLKQQTIFWLFSQKNCDGKTPFWVAIEIGHAPFVIESRKGGWASPDELNDLGDSTVFVAAACGHFKVLKALLLSNRYYEFFREHGKDTDLKEEKLIRNAEICCDIYTTDIFILTDKTKKNKFHSYFPKYFLELNKITGRNIFHACALGGSIDCLDFVYRLCNTFDLDLSLFDATDKNGNTPLMLATTNDVGGPECVYFFLSKGGDITSCNNSGGIVLKSLLVNTENSIQLLESVLNEGIIYDSTVRGLQEESECIQVDFSLFRPQDVPRTKVVKQFYDIIRDKKNAKVLHHTLFKIYIHLILMSVNYFFIFRFVLSSSSTLLLTIYLIFFSEEQQNLAEKSIVTQGIRYTLCTLSGLGVLFSLPLLFHTNVCSTMGILTYALMLLPCFLTAILILLPYGSQVFFDVAALTALVSWISLMMYSTAVFKDVSHQVAMLSHVIHGMMVYFKIVFLILVMFSLAFFCIFNDNFYFIDPVRSFIYTSYVLLQGDTIGSFEYFQSKHLSNSSSKNPPSTNLEFDSTIRLLDFCFEGTFIVVFIIACSIGLLNMLVSLAVRDGKTLAADGEIFRNRLQIHWLNSLEEFLQSWLYKGLRRTPFIYLFGIIPSRTLIDPKTKYSPTINRNSFLFSSKSFIEMTRSIGKSMKEYVVVDEWYDHNEGPQRPDRRSLNDYYETSQPLLKRMPKNRIYTDSEERLFRAPIHNPSPRISIWQ